MVVIDRGINVPFKPVRETIGLWGEKVLEACQRAGFELTDEVKQVVDEVEAVLPPLVYSRVVDAINLDLGEMTVRFGFRYGGIAEDEDELDLEALDLVLNPPARCRLQFLVNARVKAAFLGAGDLEKCATEHVEITVETRENVLEEVEEYGAS